MDSLIPPHGLRELRRHAAAVRGVSGDVAEVGVYRGGSAKVLAAELPGRPLHLFDTFAGMPGEAVGPADNVCRAGDFGDTSEARVRRLVPSARLYVGTFPGTASVLDDRVRFALVHIDVDLYRSTLDALAFFWPLLVSGGRVVLDDHNCPSCEGATLAAREFFARTACLQETGRGAWAQK